MEMAKIKEFTAYKLEDIDDGDWNSDRFTWVPVLFPYHPDRTLYFITLSVSGGDGCFASEEREDMKNISRSEKFVINSVYDACGYDPLFMIIEANDPNDIRNAIPKHTNPKYMSLTTPANIRKRFGTNEEEFPSIKDNDIDLMKSLEEHISITIKKGKFSKEDAREEFKDIENWEEFVRFVPMNMKKVISIILIQPPDDKMEEIVTEIKGNEKIIDAYEVLGESRLLIKIVTEDINEVFRYAESLMRRKTYTISKIVLCTLMENGFSFKSQKTPALKITLSHMQKDILRFLWEEPEVLVSDRDRQISMFCDRYPEHSGIIYEVKREFESVENKFVYKYSAKLDRKGWFKTLLFIKSSLEGKKIVWDGIINKLLLVDPTYFSRKYYVVTGDFDFIVPMDFHRLKTLKDRINEFLAAGVGEEKMEKYVTDIRSYFEENHGAGVKGLQPHQIACIKAMMPNSRIGATTGRIPRNIYYKYYSSESQERELIECLEVAHANPTIELYTEKLVHAFIRFKIKDITGFSSELANLREDRDHIFLYREYNPVHNTDNKMFILTTENFDSLLHFVSSLDKYSRATVTSLIFAQEFYRPDIPERFRCKPCRLPVGEKCDACPQYIKTKEKIGVINIDLKITDRIEPCTIAAVQLKVDDLNRLLPWCDQKDKEKVIEDLREKVMGYLTDAIKKEVNIVVFPEMSIPESLVEKIKETIKGHKIIVIAGTHLHHYGGDVSLEEGIEKKKYYNVCPVLISNGEDVREYGAYKNTKSQEEIGLEAKFEDIKIEEGYGMTRFINTGFGHFSILICSDFLEDERFNALSQKIDFLIVPSWNHDTSTFAERADVAAQKRWFVTLVNNGIYGESGLYAPVHKELREEPMEQHVEGIKCYTLDALELDKARDRDIWGKKGKGEKLTPEEQRIMKTYKNPVPVKAIEPIHRELWKTGV
jgi:predicted amidohydrolase/DNA-binding Lrp family transcriptional regulator